MKLSKKTIKKIIKGAIPLGIIVILFVLASLFINEHQDLLEQIVGVKSAVGILVYLLILIISVVFAPVAAMPLMPVASGIWGWFAAAIFAVIGWTIGAWIAFWLAKKYGKHLIEKIVSLDKIEKAEDFIPEENIFLTIVFLRMVLPFDGLSYALGLFTKIKTRTYVTATFIGLIPFCFVFSYLGLMPLVYQLAGFLIAAIIVVVSLMQLYKNKRRKI